MRYRSFLLLSWIFCRGVASSLFGTMGSVLTYQNEPIQLRGISWYGTEMINQVVEGLWQYPMDHYLDILVDHSFNALRIPFSVDMMFYKNSTVPDPNLIQADASLANMTSLEILDQLFRKCGERGIVILLDCHRISMSNPTPYWYIPNSSYFTEDIFFENWRRVLDHFSVYPNLLGVEIYNEPHGNATMDEFSRMVVRLLDLHPTDVLLFIDGVEWGHDFRELYGLNPFTPRSQIVYGPHVYGPTLTPLLRYTEEYVEYLYNQYFGFLQEQYNASICITEWGYNSNNVPDTQWAELFVRYLVDHDIHNQFLWALNPNGKDIKGLLKPDWKTIHREKLILVERVSPAPTRFAPFFF